MEKLPKNTAIFRSTDPNKPDKLITMPPEPIVTYKVIGPCPGPFTVGIDEKDMADNWFVHVERRINGKLDYNAAIPVRGDKERAIKVAQDLRRVLK